MKWSCSRRRGASAADPVVEHRLSASEVRVLSRPPWLWGRSGFRYLAAIPGREQSIIGGGR